MWVNNFFIGQLFQMISKLLFLLLIPACAVAQVAESTISRLQSAAEGFVLANIESAPTARIDVKAGPIDNRLPLSECSEHLSVTLPGNMTIRRNTTVYLKCEEQPTWDLYLPVRVSVQKPFVTVTEVVGKGELLTADKLTITYQDEQMLRGDYALEPERLYGARSKRELRPGQPVRTSQLCVICKGDQITLVAQTENLQIKSMVSALQDGSFGDMIRVTNLHSGREVKAKVIAVGQAVIVLH
ncbi:flagellar basal body P-ring formation protein FlgA [Aeromonas schubertii]|uniref:Flagella basal body P-ring formation protein FlgA n=2 Tax=Aeromonas schubertii TaxID=652 RepID=A0A0S2SGA2_9GAMM|nr:flagella basal body P-ring formation protein FlgA [Aeromonas schubertii]QCG48669.1 flagellar basal body P-ring formation protein FlgA [Aeromonas schubertii]